MNFNNFWFPLFVAAIIIAILFFQNPPKNIAENSFNKKFSINIEKDINVLKMYKILDESLKKENNIFTKFNN